MDYLMEHIKAAGIKKYINLQMAGYRKIYLSN
jgi:hypothetical protein